MGGYSVISVPPRPGKRVLVYRYGKLPIFSTVVIIFNFISKGKI